MNTTGRSRFFLTSADGTRTGAATPWDMVCLLFSTIGRAQRWRTEVATTIVEVPTPEVCPRTGEVRTAMRANAAHAIETASGAPVPVEVFLAVLEGSPYDGDGRRRARPRHRDGAVPVRRRPRRRSRPTRRCRSMAVEARFADQFDDCGRPAKGPHNRATPHGIDRERDRDRSVERCWKRQRRTHWRA